MGPSCQYRQKWLPNRNQALLIAVTRRIRGQIRCSKVLRWRSHARWPRNCLHTNKLHTLWLGNMPQYQVCASERVRTLSNDRPLSIAPQRPCAALADSSLRACQMAEGAYGSKDIFCACATGQTDVIFLSHDICSSH